MGVLNDQFSLRIHKRFEDEIMLKSHIFVIVALGATASVLAMAGACGAQERVASEQHVSFLASDIKDPAKADMIKKRLQAAVDSVCSSDIVADPMTAMTDESCKVETLKNAWRDLRSPSATLASQKDGKTAVSLAMGGDAASTQPEPAH